MASRSRAFGEDMKGWAVGIGPLWVDLSVPLYHGLRQVDFDDIPVSGNLASGGHPFLDITDS